MKGKCYCRDESNGSKEKRRNNHGSRNQGNTDDHSDGGDDSGSDGQRYTSGIRNAGDDRPDGKYGKRSVESALEEGTGTVGTLIDVKHTAATPVGMEVTCETTLVEVDRKRLVFTVKAYDAAGVIGEGTHERFIINNEKFLEKAQAKIK